ncbi:hypothetical protein, partial [Thiohalocapsa sp. ML1]|uniref:hypothetical protein n=1 Tax=Thiohalocapsa sp. ML1 TaxID=1431688 RepID=UPI001C1FF7BF
GGRLRMWPLVGPDAAGAALSRVGAEPAGKPAVPVSGAGTDWERRLSAGFACRGLDAPGARSAAREPGGCP